jgi:signal peptidase II
MKRRYLPFFILALLLFLFDQGTKFLIIKELTPYEVIKILPFFNIVYYRNIGSAFGLFRSLGNPFFIAISAAAVVGISVLIVKDAEGRPAFSLILAGAAGNLADRIMHRFVVDFIEVHAGNFYWPAFNIADSALTVGIAILIVSLVFGRK